MHQSIVPMHQTIVHTYASNLSIPMHLPIVTIHQTIVPIHQTIEHTYVSNIRVPIHQTFQWYEILVLV